MVSTRRVFKISSDFQIYICIRWGRLKPHEPNGSITTTLNTSMDKVEANECCDCLLPSMHGTVRNCIKIHIALR